VAKFRVGFSAIAVAKRRGFWAATVDGTRVGGRHMTEAQAAGAGLLWALGIRLASWPKQTVSMQPGRRSIDRVAGAAPGVAKTESGDSPPPT
jgi:hypothetical protein